MRDVIHPGGDRPAGIPSDDTIASAGPSTARAARRGMVLVRGGSFAMGSADFYPEELPVHEVSVPPFWMDEHPVTVAEFRRFIKATRYVTVAERIPRAADYPGADPADLVPGALVFAMASRPVRLDDWRLWWTYSPGARWRRPLGPESTLQGRDLHPVTQVAYEDAAAYAAWAGKSLPTEAEWEFAARGGLDRAVFPWGDEFTPRGRRMANTWHGAFPWHFLPGPRSPASPGTTPVRSYPPNAYGLYDVVGNVWEWTADLFTPDHRAAAGQARTAGEPVDHVRAAGGACCAPRDLPGAVVGPPRSTGIGVGTGSDADSGSLPGERFPRRVVKGGSYLCAPDYCLRYRPAARQGQTEDTATCHLGFRCVLRE
jgi:formylglycine-generating enzyme